MAFVLDDLIWHLRIVCILSHCRHQLFSMDIWEQAKNCVDINNYASIKAWQLWNGTGLLHTLPHFCCSTDTTTTPPTPGN